MGKIKAVVDSLLSKFRNDRLTFSGNKQETEMKKKKEYFSGESKKLQKTIILPTLDTPIEKCKNNIWCSSFQLAWNKMEIGLIKDPITIKGAEGLVERLNKAKQSNSDLEEESYYVNAGVATSELISKIKSDMACKFPEVSISNLKIDEKNYIAYAYLETYLTFLQPFEKNDKAFTFTDSRGNKTEVNSFREWSDIDYYCNQVEVLYCKRDKGNITEFALDLCVHTEPYQIVVAILEPSSSLEDIYANVQERIEEFKLKSDNVRNRLPASDKLIVPEMFWKITHRFDGLEGKMIKNDQYKDMQISTAMQMINFRLDRSGAELKSEAVLELMLGAPSLTNKYYLNKPFLIYMKKRDAEQPYFVMWVDNAELLTPFGE